MPVNTHSIDQVASRLKEDAWEGADLALQPKSWRRALKNPTLATEHPWLITMDPMQFVVGDGDDDAFLSLADLQLVQRYSEPLFRSREPGALIVFSTDEAIAGRPVPSRNLEDLPGPLQGLHRHQRR